MKVPFLDLKPQLNEVDKNVQKALTALMKRSDFILGQDVKDFENAFARYVDAKYAVGLNSGTDALFLGLLSLGVGPGDEVIVPTFTYIASAFAVSYTGAKPVFSDIDEKTFNIDVKKVEPLITRNTKAIMPVHLYGQSADMDPLRKLAAKHNIRIIEDAAQAHGTEYKKRKVGALGDLGCFSFYPTKNLGALGDAGMAVTNDEQVFEKLMKLRDYGRKTRYEHSSIGYNSRLDSIQAVFLKERLRRLDQWNKKRIEAASLYKKYLMDIDKIVLPHEDASGKHVYHIFAIRIQNRDRIQEVLRKKGVTAMVHYPVPLHLQEVYKSLGYKKGDFPVAERISHEVLCLPIFPHIKKQQIKFVADKIKEWICHA
jgi:dTDP-4-amino-4,6-dideoxygalactose transaminase